MLEGEEAAHPQQQRPAAALLVVEQASDVVGGVADGAGGLVGEPALGVVDEPPVEDLVAVGVIEGCGWGEEVGVDAVGHQVDPAVGDVDQGLGEGAVLFGDDHDPVGGGRVGAQAVHPVAGVGPHVPAVGEQGLGLFEVGGARAPGDASQGCPGFGAVLLAEGGDGQVEGVGEVQAAEGVVEEFEFGAVQGGHHWAVAALGDAVQGREVVQVKQAGPAGVVGGEVAPPVGLDGVGGGRGDRGEDPVGGADTVLVAGVHGYGLGEGVRSVGVGGGGRVVVAGRQGQAVVERGGVGVGARLSQGAGEDAGRAAGGERLLGEVLDDEGGPAAGEEEDAVVHGREGVHAGVLRVGVRDQRGMSMRSDGLSAVRRSASASWRAAISRYMAA